MRRHLARMSPIGPNPERSGIMYNLNVQNIGYGVLCAGTRRRRGSAGDCGTTPFVEDREVGAILRKAVLLEAGPQLETLLPLEIEVLSAQHSDT